MVLGYRFGGSNPVVIPQFHVAGVTTLRMAGDRFGSYALSFGAGPGSPRTIEGVSKRGAGSETSRQLFALTSRTIASRAAFVNMLGARAMCVLNRFHKCCGNVLGCSPRNSSPRNLNTHLLTSCFDGHIGQVHDVRYALPFS